MPLLRFSCLCIDTLQDSSSSKFFFSLSSWSHQTVWLENFFQLAGFLFHANLVPRSWWWWVWQESQLSVQTCAHCSSASRRKLGICSRPTIWVASSSFTDQASLNRGRLSWFLHIHHDDVARRWLQSLSQHPAYVDKTAPGQTWKDIRSALIDLSVLAIVSVFNAFLHQQEQPDETWSVSRVVKNLQILCSMSWTLHGA